MGGAETSLRELMAAVRRAEPSWEVRLVLGEDGPLAGAAREIGVSTTVVPFPPRVARLGDAGKGKLTALSSLAGALPGAIPYARRLARHVRELHPDIVHTNGFKMHLLGSWVCPPQARLIWHIHDYVSPRPMMSRLLRLEARHSAAAIVNSKSVAADVQGILPALPVRTLYNAVDLSRFAPEGPTLDLDAVAGLSRAGKDTVRVGLVGTFARWKGHKVFLEALSRLPAEAAIRGYIIGGPIYQTAGSQWSLEELRGEAERLGLAGKVGFTGFVDDAARAVRSLDIVVHASTGPEPFGMVVIEGMACGRAVIASAAGGTCELFVEGENAVGHPPGDAGTLAQQILRLASDPALRRRLGEYGRATAEKTYDGRRLSRELLAIYQEALSRGKGVLYPATGSASELCSRV